MSGLLDGITPEAVVTAIEGIAADISRFAPPPVGTVAGLIGEGAAVIDAILRARDSGLADDAIVKAIEAAMKLASDAEMAAELKP